MPRQPIDYSRAAVYKLVCRDPTVADCYVGSTTCFASRKANHACASNGKGANKHLHMYDVIRANGGWLNWAMVEIERWPCTDGNELRKRERYHVELLKPSLNKQVPSRSNAEYREVNKVALTAKRRDYYRNNRDQILAHASERIECPACGFCFSRASLSSHKRSQKHARLQFALDLFTFIHS
jgi:hypothetical protein